MTYERDRHHQIRYGAEPPTVGHKQHNDNWYITDSYNHINTDNNNSHNSHRTDNNSRSSYHTNNYFGNHTINPKPPRPPSLPPRKEHLKAHELYARMLYPKGHGYPLWTPELNGKTPSEYREDGIKVGDVGFITQDGGFEFLFNITLPEGHKIHQEWRGVPENFIPLDLDPQGFSTTENQIPRGGYVHSRGAEVQETGSSNLPIDTDIGFQLHSHHSEGAALLLPQGASRTDYMMTGSLHDFAAAHAETWYRYFQKLGYSVQNGSLYVISGFLKTACYYTAVFYEESPADSSRLRLSITAIPGGGFRKDFTSGDQRHSEPGHLSQNLAVFIRGWKIMLSPQAKSWWAHMSEYLRWRRDDSCHCTTESDLLRLSGENPDNVERVMSRPAMPNLPPNPNTSFSQGEGLGRGQGTNEAHGKNQSEERSQGGTVSFAQSDGILSGMYPMVQYDETELPYHPSDTINKYLLQHSPDSQIAITHDSVWCSVMHEDDYKMPEEKELIQRITRTHVIEHLENGVVVFNPISEAYICCYGPDNEYHNNLEGEIQNFNHSTIPVSESSVSNHEDILSFEHSTIQISKGSEQAEKERQEREEQKGMERERVEREWQEKEEAVRKKAEEVRRREALERRKREAEQRRKEAELRKKEEEIKRKEEEFNRIKEEEMRQLREENQKREAELLRQAQEAKKKEEEAKRIERERAEKERREKEEREKHQKHMVAAVADYDSGNWDSRYTGPAISSLPLGFVPQGPDVPVHEPNVPANRHFVVQRPAGTFRESERPDRHHASLLARIETILGNHTEYRELLAQQGELAQSLLDLLQTLYDYPGVLPKLRSKIFHAIIRLSDKSGLYPNCLALDNVTKVGDHPVAAGGFGEIWKGLIGGQMACLKVVKIYGDSDVQKFLKEFLKEAILWRQFNHPNVLPFLGLYFLDLSKQRICLISPWMEMGNLRQYLDKHRDGPIDSFALAFDIACGLSYLHEKKVVHGDLKGDNILITNFGRAAIADFGLARKVSESDTLRLTSLSTSHHVKGSTRWMAPECLLENGVHTYHSDIYAFGCVCYEVFTGKIPFYEFPQEISVVIRLNEGRRPSRPVNSRLNDNMWAFMQECWRQEPDSRPPTNILSGRILSAANRQTINPGSNWDDSLPSLLRRNIRYPEICPSGSPVDAFLFGKNPLGLIDMLPREQLYGPGKDGALQETPWTWNPRDLNDESTNEDDDFDSDSELDSPSPTSRGLSHEETRKQEERRREEEVRKKQESSSGSGFGWESWAHTPSSTPWAQASRPQQTWAPPTASNTTASSTPTPKGRSGSTSASGAAFNEADWQRRQEEYARQQQERFIQEQDRMERERLNRAAKTMTKDDVIAMFDNHERLWQRMSTTDQLRWDHFPWPMFQRPVSPEEITLTAISAYILSPHYPEKDRSRPEKDRIKEHIRRWDPDRFETKMLSKVIESDKEKVREGAGFVVRSLNDLLTNTRLF